MEVLLTGVRVKYNLIKLTCQLHLYANFFRIQSVFSFEQQQQSPMNEIETSVIRTQYFYHCVGNLQSVIFYSSVKYLQNSTTHNTIQSGVQQNAIFNAMLLTN